MTKDQLQAVAFEIILNSGDAKNKVYEALVKIKESSFEAANTILEEANDSLKAAHKAQTGLLNALASGAQMEIDVLMVHAQDHLMTTMTFRDVMLEMMDLCKRIDALER
jgi:PTS system cellobiose-specific IIA component